MQSVTLNTKNQQQIQGYWHTPENYPDCEIKGKVVIASAMGVAQAFYQPFATWLAEQGFCVFTFDCLGMGESQKSHLKTYNCNITDWVEQDYAAALQFVIDADTNKSIYWIGHSLGGQVFPLVNNIEQVIKVITVSSGTGYWKRNAPELRKKSGLLWYCIVPIVLPLFGYFPGKKIGIVGNLPKNVMAQWRKWCMHPEYCVGVEEDLARSKFEKSSIPLTSICFTDDELLSARNMHDLHALFGNKNKTLKEVKPIEMGETRVGHLGFFREQFKYTLWSNLLLKELLT